MQFFVQIFGKTANDYESVETSLKAWITVQNLVWPVRQMALEQGYLLSWLGTMPNSFTVSTALR